MSERSLDHYQIEELIGVGSSGQVYRAWDPLLERRVALKVLREESSGGDPLLEARMQARLKHEHIVQVYETGLHRGRPAVAMQLVDGQTLGAACRDLELKARLGIIEQVVRAVAFAHRGGLIHRDLKPANVLVEARESGPHAFVVDFGIATEVEAEGVTLTGLVLGTPEYMAPEQLRGERTRSSDLYALGVMLFETVAGRRPHAAETRMGLMFDRLRTPAPSLRSAAPAAPRDLVAVVDRCLAFEPEARFPSAEALAHDLSAIQRGEPVSARPLTLTYRFGSWVGRHRLAAAAAALAASALVVAGAVAVRERVLGAERAELAREFASSARDIEWTVRAIEMSPPHDSSRARRDLEARVAEVEARRVELGPRAFAAGSLAVGQAELAL
ncbi:MAG: serine/threonine-protein kinase, partial [Acidobacteriota bacterium]